MDQNNLDVYVTFVATCSAVFIGLLAFVYPQIFATIGRINLVSSNLRNRLDKEWVIKIFLWLISSFLLISILSLLFLSNAIYNNKLFEGSIFYSSVNIINYLNLFLVFLSVIISYKSYAILKKYEVEPYKLFCAEKIANYLDNKVEEKTTNTKDDDCVTIMQIIKNDLIRNDSVEKLGDYLNLYKDIYCLTKNIYDKRKKEEKHLSYPDFVSKTSPYFEPLISIQVLNQFASDAGCKDISNNLIETALGFLKEAEVKNTDPFSELFEERSRILGAVSGMFLYKILHKTYNKERDTFQVFDFYEILLSKEDYKNAIYYMRRFLMEMINFEYDFGYISYFFSIFEKIMIKNKRHMLDINIIICDLIAFFMSRSDFLSAEACFYFQKKKNDTTVYTFPIIPDRISDILLCFLGKNNVFDLGDFLGNSVNKKDSLKYKFFIFIICLNNYLILNEADRYNMYGEIEDILDFDDKIEKNINNIDQMLWRKFLDQLFESQELVSLFQLKEKEVLWNFMNKVLNHIIVCKCIPDNEKK